MKVVIDKIYRIENKEDLDNKPKLVGVARITLNDSLTIDRIKIIKMNNRLFIAMPSRKVPSGEYKDIIHSTKNEIRDQILKAISEAYEARVYNEGIKEEFHISNIKYTKVENSNTGLKAVFSIILNDEIAIHDIKLIKQGDINNYTVSMPVMLDNINRKAIELAIINDDNLKKELWEKIKKEISL